VDGCNTDVQIKFFPPPEVVESLQNDDEFMKAATSILEAVKDSNARIAFAHDCADFLNKPDALIVNAFGGKFTCRLNMSAAGKKRLLDGMCSHLSWTHEQALFGAFIAELCRLFASAQLRSCVQFNQEVLVKCVSEHADSLPVTTLSQMSELLGAMAPERAELDEDLSLPLVRAASFIFARLDAIDSVNIENIDLPGKFTATGKPATVAATVAFENFRPFKLVDYLLMPVYAKLLQGKS